MEKKTLKLSLKLLLVSSENPRVFIAKRGHQGECTELGIESRRAAPWYGRVFAVVQAPHTRRLLARAVSLFPCQFGPWFLDMGT